MADNLQFPHHWHEEVEMIYVMEGSLKIGVNNETYSLEPRDIFLIGSGDVHYFPTQLKQKNKAAIIQFRVSLLDNFSIFTGDRRFARLLLSNSKRLGSDWGILIHEELEKQILFLADEYKGKKAGYRLAIMARLYDIVVTLIRQIPMELISDDDRKKHLNRLERLEKVFQHLENNYDKDISIKNVASVANFSMYHFMRFFRETTGMTFGQYMSNFRIGKAEWHLVHTEDPITEIAFKSGFNSIKTFNRVFKKLRGCSPSDYKKQYLRSN